MIKCSFCEETKNLQSIHSGGTLTPLGFEDRLRRAIREMGGEAREPFPYLCSTHWSEVRSYEKTMKK